MQAKMQLILMNYINKLLGPPGLYRHLVIRRVPRGFLTNLSFRVYWHSMVTGLVVWPNHGRGSSLRNPTQPNPPSTRKLCYHKDDRAIWFIFECPERLETPWLCPWILFPNCFDALLFWSTLWMCTENL